MFVRLAKGQQNTFAWESYMGDAGAKVLVTAKVVTSFRAKFPYSNLLAYTLNEQQDSHTIYLFAKFIDPDLAALKRNRWANVQGKIFLPLLTEIFRYN